MTGERDDQPPGEPIAPKLINMNKGAGREELPP